MVKWLSIPATAVDVLGLVLSTHMGKLITTRHSSSRESDSLFCLPCQHPCGAVYLDIDN